MHEWISVGEAARRLNVSPSTVRRMIDAGKLEGMREVIGGDRDRFLVRLDAPEPPHETSGDASPEPPFESPDASSRPVEPPGAIIALVEELRAMRRQYDEQRTDDASRIEAAASRIAELSGRLSRAETLVETLQGLRDQWAREANEQQEARIRAEAERDRLIADLERARRRRWWRPSTW